MPCGTTGESPTLSEEEHFKVIETVVKKAAGRIQVIGGAGIHYHQRFAAKSMMPYLFHPPDLGSCSRFR